MEAEKENTCALTHVHTFYEEKKVSASQVLF